MQRVRGLSIVNMTCQNQTIMDCLEPQDIHCRRRSVQSGPNLPKAAGYNNEGARQCPCTFHRATSMTLILCFHSFFLFLFSCRRCLCIQFLNNESFSSSGFYCTYIFQLRLSSYKSSSGAWSRGMIFASHHGLNPQMRQLVKGRGFNSHSVQSMMFLMFFEAYNILGIAWWAQKVNF
ncbi:hypothetical protein K461DRAFT_52280 [Myriangium duriaei CBS 260.36]|uniref:Uncharacterized protein n=1 Tax=Myriangium duriaei CBS 260.36 TaxID=1168546 RepID=A0A9P4MIE9_9PEZI|nr:hypothetical protein K461DRAFT_52280 [Myriangium duriaei CBS 260.36]